MVNLGDGSLIKGLNVTQEVFLKKESTADDIEVEEGDLENKEKLELFKNVLDAASKLGEGSAQNGFYTFASNSFANSAKEQPSNSSGNAKGGDNFAFAVSAAIAAAATTLIATTHSMRKRRRQTPEGAAKLIEGYAKERMEEIKNYFEVADDILIASIAERKAREGIRFEESQDIDNFLSKEPNSSDTSQTGSVSKDKAYIERIIALGIKNEDEIKEIFKAVFDYLRKEDGSKEDDSIDQIKLNLPTLEIIKNSLKREMLNDDFIKLVLSEKELSTTEEKLDFYKAVSLIDALLTGPKYLTSSKKFNYKKFCDQMPRALEELVEYAAGIPYGAVAGTVGMVRKLLSEERGGFKEDDFAKNYKNISNQKQDLAETLRKVLGYNHIIVANEILTGVEGWKNKEILKKAFEQILINEREDLNSIDSTRFNESKLGVTGEEVLKTPTNYDQISVSINLSNEGSIDDDDKFQAIRGFRKEHSRDDDSISSISSNTEFFQNTDSRDGENKGDEKPSSSEHEETLPMEINLNQNTDSINKESCDPIKSASKLNEALRPSDLAKFFTINRDDVFSSHKKHTPSPSIVPYDGNIISLNDFSHSAERI